MVYCPDRPPAAPPGRNRVGMGDYGIAPLVVAPLAIKAIGSLGKKGSDARAKAVIGGVISSALAGNLTALKCLRDRTTFGIAKEKAVWQAGYNQVANARPDLVAALQANLQYIPAIDHSTPESAARSALNQPFSMKAPAPAPSGPRPPVGQPGTPLPPNIIPPLFPGTGQPAQPGTPPPPSGGSGGGGQPGTVDTSQQPGPGVPPGYQPPPDAGQPPPGGTDTGTVFGFSKPLVYGAGALVGLMLLRGRGRR